jgi:hypothetical protein
MSSFLPDNCGVILEPTPGKGNLVKALKPKGEVYAPYNFFTMLDGKTFDWIVMNPPFTPMKVGYEILDKCMEMSNNIIALMPWLTIINSEKRTKKIMDFGMVSITHLPRKTFPGSRVQTCILQMSKGHDKPTLFRIYEK